MFLKLGGFEISRLFLVAFVYFLTRVRVQIWKRSEKVVHSCSVRISHDRLQTVWKKENGQSRWIFRRIRGRLTARSPRLAPECVSGGFAWRSKRVRSMSAHSVTPALSAVTLCGPKSRAINPVAPVTRAGADLPS